MRRALPALAVAALAGCASDFAPQSSLTGLRTLALVADRPELAPREDVTIRPADWVPPATSLASRSFTFCPLSAGAVSGYACAVPRCEVQLTPSPGDGSVTVNPYALMAQCLGSGGDLPPGLPDVVQTLFRYRVETSDGAARETVLQVPQWTYAAPADPNVNPVILGVDIGGVPAGTGAPLPPLPVGGSLPVRLRIDPASVQQYVDAAGVTRSETMTGYYYSTGGEFANDLASGTDTTVDLAGTGIPPGQASLQVWVVALDLRGGAAVAGPFTVPIGQ